MSNHSSSSGAGPFIMAMCCFTMAMTFSPNRALIAAFGVLGFVNLVLAWKGFARSDKAAKQHREKELRKQKILELEKDLGYEPLNLHELDDLLRETEVEKRPREEGT